MPSRLPPGEDNIDYTGYVSATDSEEERSGSSDEDQDDVSEDDGQKRSHDDLELEWVDSERGEGTKVGPGPVSTFFFIHLFRFRQYSRGRYTPRTRPHPMGSTFTTAATGEKVAQAD